MTVLPPQQTDSGDGHPANADEMAVDGLLCEIARRREQGDDEALVARVMAALPRAPRRRAPRATSARKVVALVAWGAGTVVAAAVVFALLTTGHDPASSPHVPRRNPVALVERGAARVRIDGGPDMRDASAGTDLFADDLMAAQTPCIVAWSSDATHVTLHPGCTVVLRGSRGERVWVDDGRLSAHIAEQGAGTSMSFESVHGEVIIGGTRFDLRVAETRMDVDVSEGLVTLRSTDGAESLVRGGESGVLARGEPPRCIATLYESDFLPGEDAHLLHGTIVEQVRGAEGGAVLAETWKSTEWAVQCVRVGVEETGLFRYAPGIGIEFRWRTDPSNAKAVLQLWDYDQKRNYAVLLKVQPDGDWHTERFTFDDLAPYEGTFVPDDGDVFESVLIGGMPNVELHVDWLRITRTNEAAAVGE